MTGYEVALPFWLDRPNREAMEVAVAAAESGFGAIWVGEMATYDAFALATAIGMRAPGVDLKIGPMAVGVRTPVGLALGVNSVASLTSSRVDIALGASSPVMVTGWHDRRWANHVPVMRETIECLRSILTGARVDYVGRHVSSHGFRLREARPDTRIALGAFGPRMIRLAARCADELVLNLATPDRVADIRSVVDAAAAEAGRAAPRLTVWVPAAIDPGAAAHAQLSAQLAVYLGPPGYGEMFSALGFGDLVHKARTGATRRELAAAVPVELLDQVCAFGSADRLAARLWAYREAGADCVAVVPATAEDPAGRKVLHASITGRKS
ncbi:LLM class F420-dependent oxidoreductase [Mycobacterium sp. 1423905.2]|uniref:LLM class F420-dependent oxidoreductase n=1 Tax=Mycobacterium sp. 1423905.2 TaxID=1856859 RepID=UPI0008004F22|nr:LLM class F420-dependent oxidoreductase [Mycobacterium sp. 1423905.2]OBJ47063.1 LLM class F420-dependent oxidoreductase [Mycobacterium sp. 1423905.2]